MTKPVLLVVAGCNGSGKSTFSKDIGAGNFEPFDYDLHFLRNYDTLLDIDIKEKMAHNLTWQELENQVYAAIHIKSNFATKPILIQVLSIGLKFLRIMDTRLEWHFYA
jgi:hypothetical protein